MVKGGGKPSSPPNNLWQSKSSESDWSRGRHDGFSEGRHKGSYKGGNADADFERWQKGDIISNSWRGEKGDVIFKGTAAEKGKGSDIGAMSKGKWDGFQEAAGLQSGQTAGALWQSQSHGKQMPKGKRHDGASILDEALGKGWEGHPLQDEYSLPNFSKGESAPSGSPSYRRGAYDKGGLGKDFVAGNGKDNWKGNAEVFNSGKGKGIESLSKGAASDIFSNGGGPMMSDPRRRIHNEEMAPNRVGGQSPHLEARGGKGMKEPLVDSRWNGNGNDASFQSGWSGKGKDGFFDSGCSGKGKDNFLDNAWIGKGKDIFFDSGCSGNRNDAPVDSGCRGKGKDTPFDGGCSGKGTDLFFDSGCSGKGKDNIFNSGCSGKGKSNFFDSGCGEKGKDAFFDSGCNGKGKDAFFDSGCNGKGKDAIFDSGCSGKGKDAFFDSGCGRKGKDLFFDSGCMGKGKDAFFDSGCSGKGKDAFFDSGCSGKGKEAFFDSGCSGNRNDAPVDSGCRGKGKDTPFDGGCSGKGTDLFFDSGCSGKGKDGSFDSGCSGKGKDTFFDSAWSGKGKDLFFDSGCSGKGKDTPFVSDWNGKGKFNHSFESPENGGQMFHQMDFGKGKGSKNQLGPPLVDEQSGNKVSFEELMAVGKSLDDKGLQPTPLSAPSIPRTPSYQTSAGTAPAALSTSPMSPMGNQFWTPQGLPTSPMASMQQTGSPMASTYFSAPASFPDTWAAPQSAHQGRGAFDNIEPDGIRTPSDEGYGAEIAASIAAEMSKLLEPSPAEAAPWTPQDLTMPGLAKGLAKGAKGESGKDKGKAKDKKLSHLAEITRAQQQASIRAGRESFGTQEVEEGHPITGPMDFMGIWIDLNGNSVTVHSLDAYQVQLTATLSRAPRPDALLKIEPLDEGGWLCGNAKLDQSISSTQRLRWVRGNGQVSEWVRCRR
eukprot:TRINITY_DN3097_c0_g1_i1.p1 TRINITY_DN3097_c0_g1~~TRINITY_DN3097_c0_g1_i1.p1  ORF type:complete len:931 (-),score=205.78 TRINITY_DN3097_c0_g1_i1:59-2851(-)